MEPKKQSKCYTNSSINAIKKYDKYYTSIIISEFVIFFNWELRTNNEMLRTSKLKAIKVDLYLPIWDKKWQPYHLWPMRCIISITIRLDENENPSWEISVNFVQKWIRALS